MADWGACAICGDGTDDHEAVVLRPIAVDPGGRVLFEGTLGKCLVGDEETWCGCAMYTATYAEATQDGTDNGR